MGGRRARAGEIPPEQSAVVGANIRALRQRKGWSQGMLGELMGWPTTATVCAAEGHRGGRQRGFTTPEVTRLAGIFGVSPEQLTTLCAHCGGRPASRVRLPDLRSLPLTARARPAGQAARLARIGCWPSCPGARRRSPACGPGGGPLPGAGGSR